MAISALSRRLARLEAERGSGKRGPCPECGHDPDYKGPTIFNIPIPRVIGEPDDPNDDPSKDVCSTCGWRRVLRMASPLPPWREALERGEP